ncbi:DUF4328 domain-containing protein [Streptomyces sp. NPDC002952]|uniref:DUF4328 domain-containing protein n=1 Tax=Streptomyces sp. NPDC002952 TaxID=3364673 RepID=UPI0036C44BCF
MASFGLLAAMVTGLVLAAACDVLSLVACFRLRAAIGTDGGFAAAATGSFDSAVSLYDAAARYQVIAYLPCAIVFVVWFLHMRRRTEPLGPDRFRNGPSWAVWAWCIPLANLWMPHRVAADTWTAATPLPRDGEPYQSRLWPVHLWWTLFLASGLFGRLAAYKYKHSTTLAEARSGVTQDMVSDVLHLGAAAAAVYFAYQLTVMQRVKATAGPFGPAPVQGRVAEGTL